MPHEHIGKNMDRLNGQKDPNRIISQKLKALYSAVEQEGIPDKFMSLLEKLDEAEKASGKAERT
jgi:hypothetical protein